MTPLPLGEADASLSERRVRVEVMEPPSPNPLPEGEGFIDTMKLGRALVLTISDSASKGAREDLSGPEARRILDEAGFQVADVEVLPDERPDLESRLRRASDEGYVLVVTSGGTGLSPRDITPEATQAVIERSVPGIADLMRLESLKVTPRAALSRAISGIRGSTLIINLPGSVRGVRECLAALRPILAHAVETLRQSSLNCGE
jgi:molybdenum cofactor synthesis domain-containing protein